MLHRFWRAEKKNLPAYILEPLVAVVLVYVWTGLLGFKDVADWHSVRSGVAAFFLLFATEWAVGAPLAGKRWHASYLLFFLFILAYPLILIHGNNGWNPNFDAVKPYFMIASASASLITLIAAGASRVHRGKHALLLIPLVWILLLSASTFIYIGYFSIFGGPFAAEDMLPVVQTYWVEAVGFLQVRLGWGKFALLVVLFLVYAGFSFRLLLRSAGAQGTFPLGKGSVWLGILLGLASLYLFTVWIPRSFPVYEYGRAQQYITSVKNAEENHQKTLASMKLLHGKEEALPQKLPGTVILIIGESENKDHMKAFNPSYPYETTPWLSKESEGGNFILLRHGYTNFPQTTPSLGMALTAVNQYNGGSLETAQNIMDVAKAAGYDTWWISNHDKMNNGNTPATFIAGLADHQKWTSPSMGDDMKLLDFLKEVPEEGSHFIIINIMGSHVRYEDRVPPDFKGLAEEGKSEKETAYDNTVLYTDHVLQSLFDYARDHLHLQAMIYSSDHGEDMDYGHGSGKFTWDMARVPIFFYLSPAYQAFDGEDFSELKNHRNDIFTNDLLFDTICGLMKAETNQYEPKFDLGNPAYTLPADVAVTKHGKEKISDDPEIKE